MRPHPDLELQSYRDAHAYLRELQAPLERDEPLTSLLLGVSLRLRTDAAAARRRACLKAVWNEGRLVLTAMMVPPSPLVLHSSEMESSDALTLLIESLAAEQWEVSGVHALRAVAREFAVRWAEQTGRHHTLRMRQRLYALHHVALPRLAPGTLRQAEPKDVDLIARWWAAYSKEAFPHDPEPEGDLRRLAEARVAQGSFYLWHHSEPVSMALKTRPTRKGASVTLVYTPPERRARGYATACVAELSQLILDQGFRYCALYTDLANPTSNHIYSEIGYEPVADFDKFVFVGREPKLSMPQRAN